MPLPRQLTSFFAALIVGTGFVLPCGRAAADPWTELASQLKSADYTTRERAETVLRKGKSDAFDAVADAARRDDESGLRAVAILESWAFDLEGPFAERSERELMALSDSLTAETASLSIDALAVARDIRQLRATEKLITQNAGLRFDQDDFDFTIPDDDPGYLRAAVQPRLRNISMITIYPGWSGGEDGLWHLKRLAHRRGLYIRVPNRDLDENKVRQVVADLSGSSVSFVGASLGLSGYDGSPLRVKSVFPESAADRAGLRSEDVIIDFDGREVLHISDLLEILREYSAGDEGKMTFTRNGEVITTNVTLQGWDVMPSPNRLRMMQQQMQPFRLRQFGPNLPPK